MSSSDDVPFYLMPVAAVLGMLAAFSTVRLLYLTYYSFTAKPSTSPYAAATTPRSAYIILIITIAVSVLGYARVVASVNNAMEATSHSLFDPYELLEISTSANATVIKQAYRSLSKIHHPDKGGSPTKFQSIHLAYQALTDEQGMLNYQQYGHPHGPPSSQALDFALPSWLLHPEGNVVLVLLFLYLSTFVAIIYSTIRFLRPSKSTSGSALEDEIAKQDTLYLASNLSPTTCHLDILYILATTPESIARSERALVKIEELKQERIKEQATKSKKNKDNDDFDLLDGGGWADDEDDEEEKEAARKAKQLEEEQEKQRRSLKKAQGTETVLLEGIDEGVIGQAWVESTLTRQNKWPPTNLGFLEGRRFSYKGGQVGALEQPAVRRNLCMTHGRLNAVILNSETQLLDAGSKGLIDRTYFAATAEFRKRAGALLNAALQTAIVLRSARLAKTVIETITMFTIGTLNPLDSSSITWFEGVMRRQYGCLASLSVGQWKIHTDDEDEIATNDTCLIEMELGRPHAENFTKQKIELCKKQGIPPQVALQTFRESWWVLVTAEKLDGGDVAPLKYEPANEHVKKMLDIADVDAFAAEKQENRLVQAFPVVVKDCTQETIGIKVPFKAPAIPGKYRFRVFIKSQEFLGADQEVSCEHTIVDEATVKKAQLEDDDEAKKDK